MCIQRGSRIYKGETKTKSTELIILFIIKCEWDEYKTMVSTIIMQETPRSNLSISIITPTYNSAKTLISCLDSIKYQDYKGDIEIIIADGGSTDSTLEIAQKYTDKIYPNPLKTGEAGKAAGVKQAKNEIIALMLSYAFL